MVARLRDAGGDPFVPRSERFDLRDPAATARMMREARPEILIHLDPEGHTDRETMLSSDLTEQQP